MVKSDKCQKYSAAGDICGGFTGSKIRRLIRRAVIFSADFRRTNFRRRIRRSAAAEESITSERAHTWATLCVGMIAAARAASVYHLA